MLNKTEKEELIAEIRQVIAKEIWRTDHFKGMVNDIGDGTYDKGVEIMRENHKWLRRQRDRGDKVNSLIFAFILTTIISSTLLALWKGLQVLVTMKP